MPPTGKPALARRAMSSSMRAGATPTNSNELRCIVTEVKYKVNINTIEEIHDDLNVSLNEIARITIKTTRPLFFDPYKKNRDTGSLILIDEATNNVVGAGMIL